MRLSSALFAAACVSAAALLPTKAAAQESSWFFCYVDPPTFDSGTYVYTRVNYIGAAAIPQAAISQAMALDNPQVADRQITCWRYATQNEAEARRKQGMANDRGRGFSVHEIGWTSGYSPPAPDPPEEDAQQSVPLASPSTAPRIEPDSTGAALKPVPPAPAAPPAAGSNRKLPAERDSKLAPGQEDYAQRLEKYEQGKAEYARRQAAYARAVQEQQQHVSDLTQEAARAQAQYKQEQARYDQRRAQWKADSDACNAGDRSKCAKPEY